MKGKNGFYEETKALVKPFFDRFADRFNSPDTYREHIRLLSLVAPHLAVFSHTPKEAIRVMSEEDSILQTIPNISDTPFSILSDAVAKSKLSDENSRMEGFERIRKRMLDLMRQYIQLSENEVRRSFYSIYLLGATHLLTLPVVLKAGGIDIYAYLSEDKAEEHKKELTNGYRQVFWNIYNKSDSTLGNLSYGIVMPYDPTLPWVIRSEGKYYAEEGNIKRVEELGKLYHSFYILYADRLGVPPEMLKNLIREGRYTPRVKVMIASRLVLERFYGEDYAYKDAEILKLHRELLAMPPKQQAEKVSTPIAEAQQKSKKKKANARAG